VKSRVPSLGEMFDPHANGITLLRLALALLVVFSHAFKVGGFGRDPGELLSGGITQLGTVAVVSFMVLSGFLVTRSRELTSAPVFAWRRVLRVMPAYWVCLLVTAFVLIPLVAVAHGGVVDPASGLRYVTGNAFLIQTQPVLAEAFVRNPLPLLVNGSLWTLAPEVVCYVFILFIPSRLLKPLAPGITVALLVVHGMRMTGLDQEMIAVDFPLAFAMGACAWLFRDRVPMHRMLAAASAAGAVVCIATGLLIAIGIPVLAYLVLWLGVTVRRSVSTDLSYGAYIYAFPLQQAAAALGLHALGLAPFVAISVALALGAAALSWHLVERPVMRLKGQQALAPVVRLRLGARPRSRSGWQRVRAA
jgi:peptidoglycan/LPS O-acetylase OafA/YrhL